MSSWLGRLTASLRAAIGDVTFGMQDGAVSVAGLVFGVSASTDDASIVLLAGAAGAIAGAVSMMAGRYLDVQSVGHRVAAERTRVQAAIAADPEPFVDRAISRLRGVGFSEDEAEVAAGVFRRDQRALADHVLAYEVGSMGAPEGSPWTHATWMFVADLLAASVPVIPFAFLDVQSARLVSLVLTGILMAALGIARGRIGHVNIWWTAAQTMAIAGAAALAGVLIGRLVS